jgi:hypothetical protein
METKQKVLMVSVILLTLSVLGGVVYYLRARNAPLDEAVPIRQGQQKTDSRTRPAGSGNSVKPGSRDNGYTPIPYEQLPRGAPPQDPKNPVPMAAPKTDPVFSPDGLASPNTSTP